MGRNMSKHCTTCFINDSVPSIEIDSTGQCNVCRYYRSDKGKAELENSLSLDHMEQLQQIAEKMKESAKKTGCKYDCIIGASGGFDSSYVIYVAKKILGLNPLVVKYDNGVCHQLANENLKRICDKLGVELRIITVIDNERKYLLYSTKALQNIGVFFSACFSCHYIIASVVYREAKKEGIQYSLTSDNLVEQGFAQASHGLMAKSLINGFFTCGLTKMIKFMCDETRALYYFAKLKYSFDGFSLRFFKNLIRLHPVKPNFLKPVAISDYVAWDWRKIEDILRNELGWRTPRDTKVPYFRFDCHYSAMIDRSFQKLVGLTEHAMLLNWFAQADLIDKSELEADINYMNDKNRVQKDIDIVMKRFGLKDIPMEN